MQSLIIWLAIVTIVMYFTRGEKPLTQRQQDSLDHQSAYANERRD